MKRTALIAVLLWCCEHCLSQAELSLEQYHYMGNTQTYTYMPIMHFQSQRNWYAEARYNYEDMETFSLFLGKAFKWEHELSGSLTPLLGGSLGRFKGISTGLNIDLEYDKFFFSTQSQYSFATDHINTDFMYYWSELGYQGLSWLYAGWSVQQTYDPFGGNLLEHGALIGFTFNRFTIPVYTFAPFKKDRYFIVGLNFAWDRSANKSRNFPVVKD